MNIETLHKANELYRKIKDYEEALNCFEYKYADNEESYDRTPRLILDVDDLDNGREQIAIPMILSKEMVSFLKTEIIKGRDKAVREFNSL